MDELKRMTQQALSIERLARNAGVAHERRYARLHLKEVQLLAHLILVQLEYARLALEERQERGK